MSLLHSKSQKEFEKFTYTTSGESFGFSRSPRIPLFCLVWGALVTAFTLYIASVVLPQWTAQSLKSDSIACSYKIELHNDVFMFLNKNNKTISMKDLLLEYKENKLIRLQDILYLFLKSQEKK